MTQYERWIIRDISKLSILTSCTLNGKMIPFLRPCGSKRQAEHQSGLCISKRKICLKT